MDAIINDINQKKNPDGGITQDKKKRMDKRNPGRSKKTTQTSNKEKQKTTALLRCSPQQPASSSHMKIINDAHGGDHAHVHAHVHDHVRASAS